MTMGNATDLNRVNARSAEGAWPPWGEDMLDMLKPGNKIRLRNNDGGKVFETHHIRAIVDGDQVVYRRWSRQKQRWVYDVDPLFSYWVWHRDGGLELVGKSEEHDGTQD